MSFSYNVKEEICQSISNRDKSKACLYGLISFCKIVSPKKILFQTENDLVAGLYKKLISFLLGDEIIIAETITKKKNNTSLYSLEISDKANLIFDFYKMQTDCIRTIDTTALGKKKFSSFFVGGAFLSCGSVNDPLKEYHLEFVIPTKQLCDDLMEILLEFGIMAKQTERKNSHILYIKESENIEDMLTFIGAPKSSLEIMNVKILKDVRNKINRAVNCDNANIEKTLKASEKQVDSIEFLEKTVGFENLPEELRDIAELRLENPDWNLKEIAQALNPPISRSGANHRLTRLIKMAENLQK